jgi:uncharacterized membrane protein
MSTSSTKKPTSYGLTTGRLEALSDGVLAVVITLLVLNFSDSTDEIARLPQVTNAEILAKLANLWPHLMGYTLTFVLVAVYCLLHHMMFQHIRIATRTLVWLNVLFLLLATFLPFPTDLLAECIFHESNVVVAIYGLAHAATGLSLVALWTYARRQQLLDADVEESTLHAINRALWIGPAMNGVGVALSFVSIPLAMFIYGLIPIVYIVPPRMDRPWALLSRFR